MKSIALLAATLMVPVSAINPVETNMGSMKAPIEPTEKSREWWKAYFRKNTQEAEIHCADRKDMARLYAERYTNGAFFQMRQFHTDVQIDAIPADAKCALIFRMRSCGVADEGGIPTMTIELTSVPISLA